MRRGVVDQEVIFDLRSVSVSFRDVYTSYLDGLVAYRTPSGREREREIQRVAITGTRVPLPNNR